MSRREVYRLLEEKMLGYKDYADIPSTPEEDEIGLVVIRSSAVLRAEPLTDGLVRVPKDGIIVRRTVADRLYWAGQALKSYDKDLQLEVVCGYWSPKIQRDLFEQARSSLDDDYRSRDDLVEAAHRRIAVPDVAAHPTGAGVDVHILRDGAPIDMGTKIWDFDRNSYTFSPFVSREAWDNRQLLRRCMIHADFAPFDGEWWHFSYGDKEWACFYHKPEALYDVIDEHDVQDRMV
ncbi:M15 family metallopeptidase [Nocardia sp. NPDC057440]|uniref:M15 family metallopeptidase n=1 Tax=Nocardia sp. NPDC057440 TaxID=3346134 RepID=UPI00367023D2